MDTMPSPEAELDGFIAKFGADNQALIRSIRAHLRARMPTANELVYDNYNFFVIGYSASERPSDCIVSIAAAAKGIALSFYHGTDLVDENNVLLGSGSQNRFIRLDAAATVARPEVDALIEQAIRVNKTALPSTGGANSSSARCRPSNGRVADLHSAAIASNSCAARNFSASSAAMQPVPAAVTAWR